MVRWTVIVLCVLAARVAHAQDDAIDLTLWHPAPSDTGYLGVDGAATLGRGASVIGVFAGYAYAPLVAIIIDGDGTRHEEPIVDHTVVFDLLYTRGVSERFQVAADLPLVSGQSGFSPAAGMASVEGAGMGDLRVDGKWRLAAPRGDAGLSAALVFGLVLPTGNEQAFASSGAFAARPRVIVEARGERASLALTAGVHLRTAAAEYLGLSVQHELELGLGGRLAIGATGLSLLAEAQLRSELGDGRGAPMPIEALFGLRYAAVPGLGVTLAGGAGLTDGYGAPAVRIVFGVRFTTGSAGSPAARPKPR